MTELQAFILITLIYVLGVLSAFVLVIVDLGLRQALVDMRKSWGFLLTVYVILIVIFKIINTINT